MIARFWNCDAGLERGWPSQDYVVEAEWFQLTYEELRRAPEGDHVAILTSDGAWSVAAADGALYTDVVIGK